MAGIQKIGAGGFAMGIVLAEMECGLLKKAFKAFYLELQQRAFIQVAGTVNPHMAGGPRQISGLVILQPVGVNGGVGLAHHGVALHHGFQVGPARDAVALQKYRRRSPLPGTKGLSEKRRLLQLQAVVRHRRLAPGQARTQTAAQCQALHDTEQARWCGRGLARKGRHEGRRRGGFG